MHSKLAFCTAGLAAAFALGACGDDDDNESASTTPAQTETEQPAKVGAPGAKVSFVTPKDGSNVSGAVKVKVKLSGFDLAANQVGKPPKEGEGHLHFSMDEGKYDEPKYSGENGKLAVKLGVNGKYSPSVEPTITYKGLPPGEHRLEVYLANNDHSDTGVEAETEFMVQ